MAVKKATRKATKKAAPRTSAKKAAPPMSGMRTLGSLISRAALATVAGLRFNGARDYYTVFGWQQSLTYKDYLSKYTRQDIVARIIDAPPGATWSNPPTFVDEGVNAAWVELNKKHKLWNQLQRADRLCRLGNYSVLLFGLPGRPDTAVNGKADELLYVRPISMNAVKEITINTDATNPLFGRPAKYRFDQDSAFGRETVTKTVTTKTTVDLTVDASRVVHVVENPLEDDIFGIPIMERIFNLLDDLMKVQGGTSETYWLTANRGMQVDVDKEMQLQPADEAALSDEIEEYQHGLRRFIRTRGVDINNLGADVPDPRGVFDVIMSILSGATGIPRRILMGSEAGQLASEQDKANWAERVDERRNLFAEPQILRPSAVILQNAGLLPEGELDVEWPSAFIMSPLESAQVMAQKGRAIGNISGQSAQKMQITSREEAREILELEGDLADEDILEEPVDDTGGFGGDSGSGGSAKPDVKQGGDDGSESKSTGGAPK